MELLRETAKRMFAADPSLASVGDVGFLALLTPEDRGGTGWCPREACVVAEEAGRALTPVPWSANLLAAAALAGDSRWHDTASALLEGGLVASVVRRDRLTTEGRRGVGSGLVVVGAEPLPDVLLFMAADAEPLVVDCRSEQIPFDSLEALDTTRPSTTATLKDVRVDHIIGADAPLLCSAATIIACADSLGALTLARELVTDHLVHRMAFERPLASLQVLQHRLADLAILQAACSAMLRFASELLTRPAALRERTITATHSYFARHVPAALDECIQLAGGIGFTWEYPLHHAMRRSVANSHAVRSSPADVDGFDVAPVPESTGSDEFRTRVRSVITAHMPLEMREGHRAPTDQKEEAALRAWYRTLYEHQLLGASWPEEWGGTAGHQPVHQLIVTEELIRARAPRPIDQVQLASHVLLRFGTETQKAQYLPRIRSAQDIWCQLFSEPDCGSDLAGIRARAEQRKDGRWVLGGQKTWTTDGHWAQMGLALLRTSTEGRRHEGLTAFLVPMDAAGLEVHPKLTIGGAYEFNDVFLDGVVLEPSQVLGTVGQGWLVAMSGLEVERCGVGGNVLLLDLLLADLVSVARAIQVDGARALDSLDLRRDLAALQSDAAAARAFVDDHVERTLRDADVPADASIAKVLYSETYNAIARYGADLIAEHAPVPNVVQLEAQRLIDAWLWSRALTISGGSSEVMRNIIAKRRLRLPQ